ncbi:cGMP-stimulated cGMP phosphodiesterase [Cavenderia fasciculata]|uniref:3',5'-cyclic-GMP phosphodiesterase n=1 Tax=Cavenderia fasciculata TaxID=261658 RepID=F4PV54_CACFS|nr:cGMP-stimulated cGMP phosphodiesterase [Cavenderia fasciculata]EGG21962.1 cGMP-stimulated cGMP phosphodiesterase [Cavenderia fasciculata]|eukprot:XP_004359813.1 cGMP-stimulated cGMP phosphodiesterase [Cavenderia fasciculata]
MRVVDTSYELERLYKYIYKLSKHSLYIYINIININRETKDRGEMFKRKSMRLSPQGNYISLPRGGYVVKSDRLGNIQFGVPPETIKDSMELKIDVPTIYVFPEDLWDRRTGINAAEAEFPAYFNFFILKRKVAFVCTKEQERRIRVVFQETLLGPSEFNQGLTPPISLDNSNNTSTSTTNNSNNSSHSGHNRTHSRTGSTTTHSGGSPLRGCTAAHLSTNELVSKNPSDFLQEFAPSYPIEEIPNLELECKYLRTFNSVDELFDFVLFDDNGVAHLPKGVEIHYLEQESAFKVIHRATAEEPLEEDQVVSFLPSKIMFPDIVNRISTDLFDPPTFGITIIGSSHGFDPKKSTTGFVLWVNKRGIMIDPPLNSSNFLLSQGVPTRRVDHIILTHCHADHDSGTFQKLLEEYQITVVTTPTILNSFLRKYSALSNLSADVLRRLFIFRPVMIGEPMTIAGAEFNFFYTIHTIPTISFEVFYGGKSVYYSGDTCFDPSRIKEMHSKNIMNTARMNFFLKPWNHTIVLHEAGVPPIHTPVTSILHREQLEQGQHLWKQGDIATFGCLVAEGALEILGHDSLEPFEKGSFLGDTSAMSSIPPLEHKTTVIAKENSVIYKVLANDLFRFFEHNPGLYLAFLDTMFIDAIRDEQVYESINNFTY